MNRRFKRLAALLLALALSAACITTVFADDIVPNEYDKEMLLNFWGQQAYDGLTNGEAVYDIRLGEGGYLEDPAPTYDGGAVTRLIQMRENSYVGPYIYDFMFYYTLPGWDGYTYIEGDLPLVTVRPDLYGPLDMHGTTIQRLYGATAGQTHITSVDLDGCPYLYLLNFDGQEYCESITALDCPGIYNFRAINGAFKTIDFSPRSYDKDVHVRAFGGGSVGAWYYNMNDSEALQLFAYPDADTFVGWYKNGELVSNEPEYTDEEGGIYTACFGGDVDGDGYVTTTDALLALRVALGIRNDEALTDMIDVNGSGGADTIDALAIIRFAMGIY